MVLKPPALRPGDPVSIIAPAGGFDRASFERGLAILATRYRPVFDDGLFASDGRYLAGDDAHRLAQLQHALLRPDTRAVFCARGGYGVMRLLPQLQLPALAKPVIGFSDVTALHCALQAAGRASIHGPVLTHLGTLDPATATALFALLEDPGHRVVLQGSPVVGGIAEGPVVGGNLSVFTRLLGTPFFPPCDQAILFFEDVGERPYRLDRMWHHLALAGVLRRVAGVAMGTFEDCVEKNGSWTSEQVLRELAQAAGLPCVIGLPVGHGHANLPFPLGARARLDGADGTLTFTEGAVQ